VCPETHNIATASRVNKVLSAGQPQHGWPETGTAVLQQHCTTAPECGTVRLTTYIRRLVECHCSTTQQGYPMGQQYHSNSSPCFAYQQAQTQSQTEPLSSSSRTHNASTAARHSPMPSAHDISWPVLQQESSAQALVQRVLHRQAGAVLRCTITNEAQVTPQDDCATWPYKNLAHLQPRLVASRMLHHSVSVTLFLGAARPAQTTAAASCLLPPASMRMRPAWRG
jgi:hypothetical protein